MKIKSNRSTVKPINKEQFLAYEDVRQSGVTNMYDIKAVQGLAEASLSEEDCFEIMRNYKLYKIKYLPDELKEQEQEK